MLRATSRRLLVAYTGVLSATFDINAIKLQDAVQDLVGTIARDAVLLTTLVDGQAERLLTKVTDRDPSSIQALITALVSAQAMINQMQVTSFIKKENIAFAESRIRASIEAIQTASDRVKLLIQTVSEALDKDSGRMTLLVHQEACDALVTCFLGKPFDITRDRANVMIRSKLPFAAEYTARVSPLGLLNNSKLTLEMRHMKETNPSFRLLMNSVKSWVGERKKTTGQNLALLDEILSAYQPLRDPIKLNPSIMTQLLLGDSVTAFESSIHNLLEQTSTATLRLGVFGLHKSGKATLLNQWIGEDLLPDAAERSLKHPVIIRHDPGTSSPTLLLCSSHFGPYLDAIQSLSQACYDGLRGNSLVDRLIVGETTITYTGNQDVRDGLRCVQGLIQEYYGLSEVEGNQVNSMPSDSNWPIITIGLRCFKDVTDPFEFVALPSLDLGTINSTAVQRQWSSSLQSTHANIYVYKINEGTLDTEYFESSMKLFKSFPLARQRPWMVIATHADQTERSSSDLALSFLGKTSVIGPFRPSLPFVTCSSRLYRYFSPCRDWLQTIGRLPTLQELYKEQFGHEVFTSYLGPNRALWTYVTREEIQEFVNDKIRESNMGEVIRVLVENLFPKARNVLVKLETDAVKEEVEKIRKAYVDVLTTASCDCQELQRHKDLCENYKKQATQIFANVHISKLDHLTAGSRLVDEQLSIFRKVALERAKATETQAIMRTFGRLVSAEAIPPQLVRVAQQTLMKQLEQPLLDLTSAVRDIANQMWEQCLDNMSVLINAKWRIRSEDGSSDGVKVQLHRKIQHLKEQAPQTVLDNQIAPRCHGATSLINYGSVVSTATADPRNSDYAPRSIMVAPQSQSVQLLEKWSQYDGIPFAGIQNMSMGFFKSAPSTPCYPGAGTRGLTLLPESLQDVVDLWYDTITPQCYATVDAPVFAISRIATHAIVDVFGEELQRVDAMIKDHELGTKLAENEIEELLIADINAICACTALDELGTTIYTEEELTEAVHAEFIKMLIDGEREIC